MATNEERLAALEEQAIQQEAGSITLVGIVREIDGKVDVLIGSVRSLQAQGILVDARLNTLDARIGVLETKVSNVEGKLDQVIALLKKE